MTEPGTGVPGVYPATDGRPLRIGLVAPPFERVPPRGYGGTELMCTRSRWSSTVGATR